MYGYNLSPTAVTLKKSKSLDNKPSYDSEEWKFRGRAASIDDGPRLFDANPDGVEERKEREKRRREEEERLARDRVEGELDWFRPEWLGSNFRPEYPETVLDPETEGIDYPCKESLSRGFLIGSG